MPSLVRHLKKHDFSQERCNKILPVRDFLRRALSDGSVHIIWQMPENTQSLEEPMMESGDPLFQNWDTVTENIGVIIAKFPFFNQRVKHHGKPPSLELRLKPFVPLPLQPLDQLSAPLSPDVGSPQMSKDEERQQQKHPAPKKKKVTARKAVRKKQHITSPGSPPKRPVTRSQNKEAAETNKVRKKQKQGTQ